MDAEDHIQVSEEEAKAYAEHIGSEVVFTSAWQNKGIEVGPCYPGSLQESRGLDFEKS